MFFRRAAVQRELRLPLVACGGQDAAAAVSAAAASGGEARCRPWSPGSGSAASVRKQRFRQVKRVAVLLLCSAGSFRRLSVHEQAVRYSRGVKGALQA